MLRLLPFTGARIIHLEHRVPEVKSSHKRHLQSLSTLFIPLWLQAVKTAGLSGPRKRVVRPRVIRGATGATRALGASGGLRAVAGEGRMGLEPRCLDASETFWHDARVGLDVFAVSICLQGGCHE